MASTRLFAPLLLAAVFGGSFAEGNFHFSYNHHGEDWIEGECASRDRQSPIDFNFKAPWKCKPPMLPFLRHFLGPEHFIKLGFAALAGDDIVDDTLPAPALDTADAQAPAGAPAPAGAAAPAAASMLQVHANMSQPMTPAPYGVTPAPYGVTPMPTAAPTRPPMIVPGCGQLDAFFYKYDMAEKTLTTQNNGHTISTDLKGHGLGSITWEGAIFDVLSVNFHVHSEHTFHGKAYPLELHIVHREPETEHILVIAVPFDELPSSSAARKAARKTASAQFHLRGGNQEGEDQVNQVIHAGHLSSADANAILPLDNAGPKEPVPTDPGFNEALANLMPYPLPKEGESKPVPLRNGPVDLISPLLGGSTAMPEGFFQYRGSLTAPPCSEQVTWLVRKNPLYASRTQLEVLRVAINEANSNFNNARSVMPLMGRNILYRLGIKGDAPPPPEVPFDGSGEPPKERVVEFRGISAGKEAIFKALQASQAKDTIASAIAAAQAVRQQAGAAVNPAVVAAQHAAIADGSLMITTPLPTPDPERVLSRIVDAVADQMDGAEKAAAMAAAGVVAAPPAAAPPAAIR